ncbi:MAG: hypothetical protein HS108_10640 [Planctomycetes bacterium]|jgi:hypothetical protein|nr:hypothetical protein [Planctomycetota bacterium]MCL4730548.1 hypothetical protein [Planctomycetota bacterium]
MAKKAPPPPVKKAAPAPAAAQNDAVGRFDKFGTFALALPCTVLALAALIMAVHYTSSRFDTGLFGFPGKKVMDWDSGAHSVGGTVEAAITGFESHNYIGRLAEGEVDVVVLNVGSDQRVNLGDVFVLAGTEQPDVRVEFVVFDLQSNISRAYILLGQNVEGGKARQYSLRRDDVLKLCGGAEGATVKVKRPWKDQIVRRYVEARSTKN